MGEWRILCIFASDYSITILGLTGFDYQPLFFKRNIRKQNEKKSNVYKGFLKFVRVDNLSLFCVNFPFLDKLCPHFCPHFQNFFVPLHSDKGIFRQDGTKEAVP